MSPETACKVLEIVQKHKNINRYKSKESIAKAFEFLCEVLGFDIEDIINKGFFDKFLSLVDIDDVIITFKSVKDLHKEDITSYKRKFMLTISDRCENVYSEDFLRHFDKILDFNMVSIYQELSEKFIEDYADKVNWDNIVENQVLSESIVEKHFDDLCSVVDIIKYQRVSEEFLRKHKKRFNGYWQDVISHQVLSEAFLEEIMQHVDSLWEVFSCQKLSEEFIRKHHNDNKSNWAYISSHQKLSESFIEEFANKVNWWHISRCQNLSESFIEKYKDKVDWSQIGYCQKLSPEFREKWSNFLPIAWERATKENKLSYLKRINCYEIVNNEYVIAYKAVKRNYTDINDNKMLYEIGKEYESICDCNINNDTSFSPAAGLYAWTKKNLIERFDYSYYGKYPFKLLKVHIDINDIGIVLRDGQIHARKIKVVAEESI